MSYLRATFVLALILMAIPALAQEAAPVTETLMEAVQKGNVEAVERLIANDAKPTGPEMDILQQAYAQARENKGEGPKPEDYETISSLLIAKYPEIIRGGSSGVKQLYTAAHFGNVVIAKQLIDAGLNPNAKDGRGRSPLFDAVKGPSPELVALLVEGGADVNAKDNAGKTPLVEAAQAGSPENAVILVEKGADIAQTDSQGWTPLHHAYFFKNDAVAKALTDKGADAAAKNADGLAPEQMGALYDLFMAVSKGEADKVGALLDTNPAIVNARCAVGGMPLPDLLMSRAQGGFTRLAGVKEGREAYLANTTPEQRDEHIKQAISLGNGWTPLHQAVMGGETDVVKVLIEKKADVNAKAVDLDLTPLFLVCMVEDQAILLQLIEAGADVKVTDSQGNTPLHTVATYGGADTGKVLIEKGADINAKNNEGKTPLAIVVAAKEQAAKDNPPEMPRDYAQAIVQGMDSAKRAEIAQQNNLNPDDEEAMVNYVQKNTPMTLVNPIENLLRENGAQE